MYIAIITPLIQRLTLSDIVMYLMLFLATFFNVIKTGVLHLDFILRHLNTFAVLDVYIVLVSELNFNSLNLCSYCVYFSLYIIVVKPKMKR